MRFAHFSDTHLGFRQYGIYERELDFYRAFEKAVAKMIEERPDFVLHSGDLFDLPKPPPRALWVAQRCFAKLREKGIPVYAITGNHDMLFRRGAMPPQVLYRDLNVRVLTEDEPFVMHGNVFIGGVPYFSRHYSSSVKEMLQMLSLKAGKHGKSIVMLHQGTDRHLPKGFELETGDIPGNFSYYAMGHVHARITEDFGRGKFVYPGSTELWSANELDDYRRKGKGFALVDMHGDVPEVQSVDIELEREIIKESLGAHGIEDRIRQLEEKLGRLPEKPLLYLDVKEGSFERAALHDMLTSRLSGQALSLRMSYLPEPGKKKAELGRPFDLPQMQDIIRELIRDRKQAELASKLFMSFSEGNDERALKEAETFYRGMGGGKP